MTDAKQRKAIKDEADYLLMMVKRIHAAACGKLDAKSGGTITNLAPEVRKSATRLSRLTKYDWENVA